MIGYQSVMSCFREMEYQDMKKQVWKPKIEKLINTIQDDSEGWKILLELYNPDTRCRKREDRYEEFKRHDLHTKWQVNEDFFSQGWFGLDQMMINITTPGFKKKGVAIKENKLEYLEKLWLFSTKEADKKIKIELENQRNIEIEERRDAGTKIFARTFIIIIFLAVAFTVKSCVDSIDEENSNHPVCKKLGLKSNWNNTKCY
jgi:hypothetical protein